VDVLYGPLKTSDNAVQYGALLDLANRGRGNVGKTIGQVFALP
jgi:hypothetical protein